MNILVLCTGSSARSMLLECLLDQTAGRGIQAFSACDEPPATVNPVAMRLLAGEGFDTSKLRTKSWEEFLAPEAPRIDLAITVCGNAEQSCPVFPGTPIRAHWGLDDPVAVAGDAASIDAAFRTAYHTLERRARAFLALDPVARRDPATLAQVGEL